MGFLHLDPVVFCGGFDVREGLLAFVVGDVFDLVEAGDGVADVRGVVERLFFACRGMRRRRRGVRCAPWRPGRCCLRDASRSLS